MLAPMRAVLIYYTMDSLQDVAKPLFIVRPANDEDNLVAGEGDAAGCAKFK